MSEPIKRIVRANGLEFGIDCYGAGGPLFVLLHGFPDTQTSMGPLAQILSQAGAFVVAPALRGYPPTAPAPDGRYDLEALAQDVIELIDVLGYEKAVIVGHDWGAAIAYATAAIAADRIVQVFALSVPPIPIFLRRGLGSLGQLWHSRYMFFFQLPYLPERRLTDQDGQGVRTLWERWAHGPFDPAHLESACKTLTMPGVAHAALSYYRTFAQLYRSGSRRSIRLGYTYLTVPTRVLVGARDNCVAPSIFQGCPYPLHVIPGVGHFLPSEAPNAVGEMILEYWHENPKTGALRP